MLHFARQVLDHLQEANIQVMDWSPRNPDLNPIQHILDTLKRTVKRRLTIPSNLQQL